MHAMNAHSIPTLYGTTLDCTACRKQVMVGRRAPRGYRAGFAHGLCRRRTVYRFSDGDNLCNGDFATPIASRAQGEAECFNGRSWRYLRSLSANEATA